MTAPIKHYSIGDTVEVVASAIPEMVGLRGVVTGFPNGRVMVKINSKNTRSFGQEFLFPRERIKHVESAAPSLAPKADEEGEYARLRAFFFPTEKPKCLHCGSTTIEKGFNRDYCPTPGCKNYSAQLLAKSIEGRLKRLREALKR